MNALRTELRLLRWHLLCLAAVLMIAVGMCSLAQHFMSRAKAAASAAEQNAVRTRGETRQLQNDEQDMRAKIAEYQAIAARGITGPEQRLNWVELIRGIERERQLIGVEYEIQPQAPLYKDKGRGGNSGYTFMNSPMRLRMALLHEEDLLRLLDDLQNKAPALTRLRSCRISRNTAAPPETGPAPQLLAECQIDWITLKSASGAQP